MQHIKLGCVVEPWVLSTLSQYIVVNYSIKAAV